QLQVPHRRVQSQRRGQEDHHHDDKRWLAEDARDHAADARLRGGGEIAGCVAHGVSLGGDGGWGGRCCGGRIAGGRGGIIPGRGGGGGIAAGGFADGNGGGVAVA